MFESVPGSPLLMKSDLTRHRFWVEQNAKGYFLTQHSQSTCEHTAYNHILIVTTLFHQLYRPNQI